jgi:hypothetical protein
MGQLASDIFGFSPETIEASKNILPTFNLVHKRRDGSIVLDIGTEIDLEFIGEPKKVTVKDTYGKKGSKKDTFAATVLIHEIRRPQDGTTEKLVVPVEQKYNLWLSSGSLQLGLTAALDKRPNWDGFRCVVIVDMAEYKQGENTAYRVIPVRN